MAVAGLDEDESRNVQLGVPHEWVNWNVSRKWVLQCQGGPSSIKSIPHYIVPNSNNYFRDHHSLKLTRLHNYAVDYITRATPRHAEHQHWTRMRNDHLVNDVTLKCPGHDYRNIINTLLVFFGNGLCYA